MRSSRLPGKALLPLGPENESVLWWTATRARLSKMVNQVAVATTNHPSNDRINAPGCWIMRYTGNEDDVIGRVLATAKHLKADVIVDITGDCPLADPRHIDHLVKMLLDNDRDYVSNDVVERSWPDGLDIQVYWTKALMKCKELFDPRTHCGWNIDRHPNDFGIEHWRAPHAMRHPEWGLTLDTPEDYELLKIIFDKFGAYPAFKVEGVIEFLQRNSYLLEINKSTRRKAPDEG